MDTVKLKIRRAHHRWLGTLLDTDGSVLRQLPSRVRIRELLRDAGASRDDVEFHWVHHLWLSNLVNKTWQMRVTRDASAGTYLDLSVFRLTEAGVPVADIATLLGCADSTVYELKRSWWRPTPTKASAEQAPLAEPELEPEQPEPLIVETPADPPSPQECVCTCDCCVRMRSFPAVH